MMCLLCVTFPFYTHTSAQQSKLYLCPPYAMCFKCCAHCITFPFYTHTSAQHSPLYLRPHTRLQCFECWVCSTLQRCSLVLTGLVKDYFDFSLECYWGCCHWTLIFYWVIVEKLNPKILIFRLSKQGRSVGHVLKGETGDRPPFNSRWGAGYITWCWVGFDWISILVVY